MRVVSGRWNYPRTATKAAGMLLVEIEKSIVHIRIVLRCVRDIAHGQFSVDACISKI